MYIYIYICAAECQCLRLHSSSAYGRLCGGGTCVSSGANHADEFRQDLDIQPVASHPPAGAGALGFRSVPLERENEFTITPIASPGGVGWRRLPVDRVNVTSQMRPKNMSPG